MKVKELIKELKKQNPEHVVRVVFFGHITDDTLVVDPAFIEPVEGPWDTLFHKDVPGAATLFCYEKHVIGGSGKFEGIGVFNNGDNLCDEYRTRLIMENPCSNKKVDKK